MSKQKNSIRIGGTTFNKSAITEMTEEQFVKRYMYLNHVFPGLTSQEREKRLKDTYKMIAPAPIKSPEKE